MSDVRRIGPIGLVNEDAVFIKLLDGSDLKLTCIAGPYAVAVYDAIATALRTARNEALEEAALKAEHLNGWGIGPIPEVAEHIAKRIRALKHKDGQP